MKPQKICFFALFSIAFFGFAITISAAPYDKEELQPKINGQLFFPHLNLESFEKCRDSVDLGAMKNRQWAICDKIELNNLDIVLNTQYQLLRKNLEKDQQAKLRDAQQAWLKYREQWCRFEQFGPSYGLGEASHTDCLLEITNLQIGRIKALAQRN